MSRVRVEVVHALPDRVSRVVLELSAGATVDTALEAARASEGWGGIVMDADRLAVFGRLVALSTTLADGDRIEILRPLVADPKQARRERAARAGGGR